MKVRDLKKLRTLIVVQEWSHRDIADAAGWKSHSYVGRLLRGDVKTLKPEPAIRIAKLLGVPVEDIFLTQMDTNLVQGGRVERPTRRKVAA